ncbi:MAG TPA: preprotein translocase subunit SecA, partial [Dehalococcoidia bacterium]|nr:preprotein translocase subunit SecA [Dehalococcoidia bacterium]
MFKWLTNILDSNEKEIGRLRPLVAEINALEPEFQARSDQELQEFVARLRQELQEDDAVLDDVLPEVFAAVREAAVRTIGQRHYDVQLMGGAVLHQGKIAEMKTGEGKTLVATLPVTLNALTGAGVHLVTVNDYLAKRDTQWMGPIYHLLGLSVASIQHDATFLFDPDYTVEDPRYTHLRPVSRREGYEADITYGTNNEFGFDYLRDNMAGDISQLVQRPLNYAIVDEVDNILIDEARTPLIISGAAEESTEQYYTLARLVPQLQQEEDYTVDEKLRSVTLTEGGIAKLEKWLKIPNLYDPEHYQITHFVETALKAHVLYVRDRDYMVKNGEVIIVDEFTGRQMPGRRWSDGLHQAVEAKEGVKIQRESLTLATITFQNYFRLYNKLAGMTGTAVTEAEEFNKIYKLEVMVIPTNVPMIRQEFPDYIYKTQEAKFKAAADEVEELYKAGRPVLVGTVSIEKSEYLSELLKRRGIPHQVLNAKFHEREASIVVQAGRSGSVTIATNMAGRGTDILLGGNPEGLALEEALRRNIDPEQQTEEYQKILAKMKGECAQDHERVVALAGLHILGTERHESRRIDNQLRGRSGRQGDPGSSRFYVSLEDDILRRFGGDRIKGFMEWAGLEDDVPIEHSWVSKSLENAQTKVEGFNFDIRKHLVEYDDVMNTQRETIYAERRKVLEGADLKANVQGMLHDAISQAVEAHLQGRDSRDWDLEGLFVEIEAIFPSPPDLSEEQAGLMTRGEVEEALLDYADALYEAREEELGPEQMRVLERMVVLHTIDSLWIQHL